MTTAALHIAEGNQKPSRIFFHTIKKAVAAYYSITVEDLDGPSRSKYTSTARQICIWLGRKHTRLSYPDLARRFGGRDHTTAIHAVNRIDERMATDIKLRCDILNIEEELRLSHD